MLQQRELIADLFERVGELEMRVRLLEGRRSTSHGPDVRIGAAVRLEEGDGIVINLQDSAPRP